MDVDVVDASGTSSCRHLMLHHVVFLNLGEARQVRPPRLDLLAFLGLDAARGCRRSRTASTRPARSATCSSCRPGYGYPVKGKDHWVMLDVHEPPRPLHDRSTSATGSPTRRRRSRPPTWSWLDVRNCLSDPGLRRARAAAAPARPSRAPLTWTAPQPGRLVAGGGHVHGGGRTDRADAAGLRQPRGCSRREPLYGPPDDPVYRVRPVLHEPGPINMSGFTDVAGSGDREGSAASDPRRLRQQPPALARDGDLRACTSHPTRARSTAARRCRRSPDPRVHRAGPSGSAALHGAARAQAARPACGSCAVGDEDQGLRRALRAASGSGYRPAR